VKGLLVSLAKSPFDIEQVRDIRRSVLCGELNWPREVVEDPADLDPSASLFLASLGPKPLASARLIRREGAWHAEALAVLPHFRGQGAGRALLSALEDAANGRLWAAPTDAAAPFFEHCGYTAGIGPGSATFWKNG
jgi:GNAT superfamily N-acetyltransferase